MKTIVVHYDEIGLKGKNRRHFEQVLLKQILKKIQAADLPADITGKRLYGRLFLSLPDVLEEQHIKILTNILETTFGIAYSAFAESVERDIQIMEQTALRLIKEETFETFAVDTQRSDKTFPLTSPEVNRHIGAAIVEASQKGVKLRDPDVTCSIEILHDRVFIYTQRIKGPGGLPKGVSGKAIIMMSGGIDSPVASYYAQKRGLEPVYVHFHSYPFTSDASIEKVRRLVQQLDTYSGPSTLYMCAFSDIQKQLIMHVPDKYRILMYRRFMMRIAEQIAKQVGAKALITGEALGQVASQTIENITVVQSAAQLPILRPLIGFDKKDIMRKAKDIGTYDISVEPHDDCCTVFMPKRPETKGRLEDIEEIEQALDVKRLVEEGVKHTTCDL